MLALALLGLFVFGLVVGSFLNVVIVRVPAGQSVVSPPSRCPQCEVPIQPRDNIPVVSWILLKGRCRSCGNPIPAGYPLVELGNALLWVAAGVRFLAYTPTDPSQSLKLDVLAAESGLHRVAVLVPFLYLFSVLLALSVIDLELYRLPDKLTVRSIPVSIVLIGVASFVIGNPGSIGAALIGGVLYFLFLFLPALVYPKGMGLGDVKLAGLMGLYLGWLYIVLPLLSLLVACLVGVVVGGILYFVRGRESRAFPFGPWLAAGCVLAVLFSAQLTAPFLF